MNFEGYVFDSFYDEMMRPDGRPRPHSRVLYDRICSLPEGELRRRQRAAEKAFFDLGITFSVYGDAQGTERIIPFDMVPRIIDGKEWNQVEAGLKQRITALNLFIRDIYHDQQIIRDGVIPREVLAGSKGFLEACVGITPPGGVWCHITGTDLVRDHEGRFLVLEDNLRVPSGVSYVLANRQLTKRTFPNIFAQSNIRPVEDYPNQLRSVMQQVAPPDTSDPCIGVLTPGIFNSAYFEHSFLAQQTGATLVEGRDLVVDGGRVCVRTTRGLQKLDVLYRRINDDFLDPQVFNPNSVLGVPGIMDVYRKGGISILNAPGTGVADDKVIYAFVPDMIRYYLDQDALLPNVPTYLCLRDQDRRYVLDHLEELVVKPANEAGGYGMLIGTRSTAEEREQFARLIEANPRNYIAQPVLSLSRVPIIVDDHFEGRHVDLRPFILYGEDIHVIPGGLTRVALTAGSLVVNSSQGGGSKDTWVLDLAEDPDGGGLSCS